MGNLRSTVDLLVKDAVFVARPTVPLSCMVVRPAQQLRGLDAVQALGDTSLVVEIVLHRDNGLDLAAKVRQADAGYPI